MANSKPISVKEFCEKLLPFFRTKNKITVSVKLVEGAKDYTDPDITSSWVIQYFVDDKKLGYESFNAYKEDSDGFPYENFDNRKKQIIAFISDKAANFQVDQSKKVDVRNILVIPLIKIK